jgi:hypothetical protein
VLITQNFHWITHLHLEWLPWLEVNRL